MATYQLRAMSVGEILDGALVLVRRHFGILLRLAIICLGVPAALDIYVESAGGLAARPGLWGLSRFLNLLGYLLVTGAAVRVVSEAYLGRAPAAGEALRFAVGKMWAIFVSGVAASIVIVLAFVPAMVAFALAVPMAAAGGGLGVLVAALAGVLLLVLPIVVVAGYAVVVQAVVLEPLPSAISGLGRSWALTKGHRGKAVVLWLVLFALLFLLFLGVALVGAIFAAMSPALMLVAVAVMTLLVMLVYPLMSCVFTLLYYDLRVRKEAFDLELLSQQIGLLPAGA